MAHDTYRYEKMPNSNFIVCKIMKGLENCLLCFGLVLRSMLIIDFAMSTGIKDAKSLLHRKLLSTTDDILYWAPKDQNNELIL